MGSPSGSFGEQELDHVQSIHLGLLLIVSSSDITTQDKVYYINGGDSLRRVEYASNEFEETSTLLQS